MGNALLKVEDFRKQKLRKKARNRKIRDESKVIENGITNQSKSKENVSNLVGDGTVSLLETNASNVEAESSDGDIVTDLEDSNLVTDGAVKIPKVQTCKPVKQKSEHVEQEWSVNELVDNFPDFQLVPVDQRENLVESVKTSAWLAFPQYFYDFCLISSDLDYEEANKLKENLCSKYDLTGCMLDDDDFNKLGRDVFQAFENMIRRCTKIFFYITDNFNDNGFYMRVQNGAVFQSLMSQAREKKEKCVPVFPEGLREVPLALSGIGGLEIPNERITAQRIRITYTEKVRNQRLEQERMNNEKRKASFMEYLRLYVRQCLEESEKKQLDDSFANMNFLQGNNSQKNLNEGSSSSTSKILNDVKKIIESTSSTPVVHSSEVNVTSSSAHIGHNITVTINTFPTKEEIYDDSTDSDDSDSELSCSTPRHN